MVGCAGTIEEDHAEGKDREGEEFEGISSIQGTLGQKDRCCNDGCQETYKVGKGAHWIFDAKEGLMIFWVDAVIWDHDVDDH